MTMEATAENDVPLDVEDDFCPCRYVYNRFRGLQDEEYDDELVLWKILYTCAVLLLMLWVLATDRIGADSAMLAALAAFMVAGILTIPQALAGFSNEGLLTVMTLFVVANGLTKTGAVDWYMAKFLGLPKNATSAQARLMIPIALVSAFLSNTLIVAVMIPVVQAWARNIRVPVQQLLIPLSFATILGGTCTLIGTSTNLVVVGLLQERYPNDPSVRIRLFDLSVYGVPIAIVGITYILVASPFLLPGGSKRKDRACPGGNIPSDNQEGILLGARLTPWSPATGRSIGNSGLRNTGGIYLVSVRRAATGNLHRAVGQDFVLEVGDILYFTGLVEGFGQFCEEHGMEVLTHERTTNEALNETPNFGSSFDEETNNFEDDTNLSPEESMMLSLMTGQLKPVLEGEAEVEDEVSFALIGQTARDSLMTPADRKRSRAIMRMTDTIRGFRDSDLVGEGVHKVVVTSQHGFVIVGIDAHDRPGLMSDISMALSRLNLNLRHSEASVVRTRSISVWRCGTADSDIPELEEIWSVFNALLESETGSKAMKQRGLRVIRAVVTKISSLVGKKASEVDFRKNYRSAIVAVQKGGKNVSISKVVFGPGDVLVLQVSEDSPLLKIPPPDFYKRDKDENHGLASNSVVSFVNMLAKTINYTGLQERSNDARSDLLEGGKMGPREDVSNDGGSVMGSIQSFSENIMAPNEVMMPDVIGSMETKLAEEAICTDMNDEAAWNDLQVSFMDGGKTTEDGIIGAREFLTAMEVAPKSKLANQTAAENGLDKLHGVFLVSIDRPKTNDDEQETNKTSVTVTAYSSDIELQVDMNASESVSAVEHPFIAIDPDSPLNEGDVLWFAGSASSLGDLRKIPGLRSHETDEVKKLKEKVSDRRLVEAVVARRGSLVGKTVKEVRFRTRYGAAVIAVHREGNRIHDHPGQIKLRAGDVLLLEAGPTFMRKSMENDRSLALIAEVADSAPPRFRMLIPAVIILVAMLAVYIADVASLLVCALVASMLMVGLGVLSEQEARDAIRWEVFLTIAAAFGIGDAMVNSGVAGGMAKFLVKIGEAIGIGDAGLLGSVYLVTFLISGVVTNNAAAALVFPIAMDAADASGTDVKIMSYCVILGASASFMSPFSYTTNLLIYGPGGYKFNDFVVFGTPMQLILWVLSVVLLSTTNISNWWTVSCVTLIVVLILLILNPFSFIFRNGDKNA